MNRFFVTRDPWFRSLLLIGVVISIAIACSKNNGTPAAQTGTMEGNWKANSLKLNGSLDILPSLTATYGSYLTDVTLSFKAGGAVSYDNPTSCSASAASIATLSTTTGIDANSTWSQSGAVLTITPSVSTNPPKSFTTTFGTGTVQLQGSGALPIPGSTTPVTSNFTLELRKL